MPKETWEEEIEEIWALFRETRKQFQETREQFQETREQFQETREQLQETDRLLKESSRETTRRFRETDDEISRLANLFTGQWGRLVEALVAPGTVELFRERGIAVSQIAERAKSHRNGKSMEIDILAENADEVVALEVKTTLRVDDVRRFLSKLERFLVFFPKYSGYHIYGSVAALNIEEGADRFAYRQGLFVLGFVGDGIVEIMNDSQFEPRDFRATQSAREGGTVK